MSSWVFDAVTASRLLRGDEDSGRSELVLAGPLRARTALVTQTSGQELVCAPRRSGEPATAENLGQTLDLLNGQPLATPGDGLQAIFQRALAMLAHRWSGRIG